MVQILGGDLVGMSTVPEVILARYYGLKVAAISVVTNLAAGIEGASPSHQETKDTAAEASEKFKRLIRSFVAELPMSDDADRAPRALRCLDLTDLTETCTDHAHRRPVRKGLDPRGPVAAVCVWPQFVSRAREPERLAGAHRDRREFPGRRRGRRAASWTICSEALGDGANEIDLVLPYRGRAARRSRRCQRDGRGRARRRGQGPPPESHPGNRRACRSRELIETASRIAIEAGADFIKTSTGKTPVSATPEAAEIMLDAIKASGRPVGLRPPAASAPLRMRALSRPRRPHHGRRTGRRPKTFRIGASSVYDALIAAIEGRAGTPATGAY